MILIRGVSEKKHAIKINEGVLGCRDLPSILLEGVGETGYRSSNYYEWLFRQSLFGVQGRIPQFRELPSEWARIFRVLGDPICRNAYLSYFHILNEEITEAWISSNWDDTAHFFYIEPEFEMAEFKCLLGSNYFAGEVEYVSSESEINPKDFILGNPGFLGLLDTKLSRIDIEIERLDKTFKEIVTFTPLFHRIENGRFNNTENEFRFLFLDECISDPEICLECSHETFRVVFSQDEDSFKPILLNNLNKEVSVEKTAWKNRNPRLVSRFKDFEILDSLLTYGYIGNKEDCLNFIKTKMYLDLKTVRPIKPIVPKTITIKDNILVADRELKNVSEYHVALPEKNFYSRFGPGFKETSFPNPLELGLTSPQDSFLSALVELTRFN